MNFKQLLKAKKITQEQLTGKFLDKGLNMHRQQIGRWVSGKGYPDHISFVQLSLILNEPMEVVSDALVRSNIEARGVNKCKQPLSSQVAS